MNPWRRNFMLMAIMFAASAGAVALRPTPMIDDKAVNIDLEAMVPKEFGGWRIDTGITPIMPSPDVEAALSRIYTQTLTRTYVNAAGQRIMLSIAYGSQQNDQLRVHQPEGCYVGQGFHIARPSEATEIATSMGPLHVTQLTATSGARREPITYWVRIGDSIARTQWEMKKIQLRYGLTGSIPDGMLVRVSSISPSDSEAFALQRDFINDLLSSVDASQRRELVGKIYG